MSPTHTYIWSIPSGHVNYASSFLFASSLLLALIYEQTILASVISTYWNRLLGSSLPLEIILYISALEIMPPYFFKGYLVNYLYNPSPRLTYSYGYLPSKYICQTTSRNWHLPLSQFPGMILPICPLYFWYRCQFLCT